MIRHTATHREDRVKDAVGCLRSFGGVFVLTGGGALACAVLGWAEMGEASEWERLGVAAIGAMHLAGGLAFGWQRSARARVTRAGVEWEERRLLRSVVRRRLAPSEIGGLNILTDRDSDGDEHFRVALVLRTGETLPLTRGGTLSREHAEEIRDALATRIGV